MKNSVKLYLGNSEEVLKGMKENSVDTIITDPPYGLSFMSKKWDYDVPSVNLWKEVLRVLKPGGTALIFAGSRTQHRIAVNVEDAGFILKDCIMWIYGSGFPKATDISKNIQKSQGVQLKDTGIISPISRPNVDTDLYNSGKVGKKFTYKNVTTPEAKLWEGWKSHGLKPAYEPIIVAMKPNDGTYANNALVHGVSGLNIDGGRITKQEGDRTEYGRDNEIPNNNNTNSLGKFKTNTPYNPHEQGRFPANIILDEEAGKMLDEQSGISKSTGGRTIKRSGGGNIGSGKKSEKEWSNDNPGLGDKGGASRFFYCAKASKSERNAGCERIITWENVDVSLLMEKLNLHQRDILEDILQNTKESEWNMMLFGKEILEKYQKDLSYIIKIILKMIIESKTWNLNQILNIKEYILDAFQKMENGISLVENVENLKKLRGTIINEKMELVLGASLVVLKMLLKIKEQERIGNVHSTVKPLKLMEYLCTLTVTPTGGIVLDPFMGSGTTGVACKKTGRSFIGVEMNEEYMKIAQARIKNVKLTSNDAQQKEE